MKRRYSVFQGRRERHRRKQLKRWERRVEARRLRSAYFPRDDVQRAKNYYFLRALMDAGFDGVFAQEDITTVMQSATARDEVLNFGYGDQLKWAIRNRYIKIKYAVVPKKELSCGARDFLQDILKKESEKLERMDASDLEQLGFERGSRGYFLTSQGEKLFKLSVPNELLERYKQSKRITIDDKLDNQRQRSRLMGGAEEKVLVGASKTKYV